MELKNLSLAKSALRLNCNST